MESTPWLAQPWLLALFVLNSAFAVQFLIRDLRKNNREIGGLMKVVWGLTVLYSGFVGLAIYHFAGRKQIRRDSLWRRAFRSVAHCYSGCGAGEIAGLILAAVLGLNAFIGVAALTFAFAYLVGLALTLGPLLADGVPWSTAIKDAVYSESASIVVMEMVAIAVDLTLAGDSGPTDVRFWTVLAISLSAGLAAAYPINVVLIHRGVKEGMHDPRALV